MKRRMIAASLLMVLLAAGVFVVSATCDTAGTPANDTITCTGTSTTVNGDSGEDTITVDGTLTGSVIGGADEDTITVDGTLNGFIYGDLPGNHPASDDTIIINGTVNGAVIGDSSTSLISAGNDTIMINGTITGNVIGEGTATNTTIPGGDDTVILQDGANGGSDNTLLLVGVIGNDTLIFQFTMNSEVDYQALSALIAAADPINDSIVFNGQTYTWLLFDNLVNDLIRNYALGGTVVLTLPLPEVTTEPAAPAEPPDGRINWDQRGFAPVAIYCRGNSVQVYNPAGQMLFMGNSAAIEAAFAASADVNQQVAGGAGFSLWTLNRTHELQVHADAGGYDYIFPARCIG